MCNSSAVSYYNSPPRSIPSFPKKQRRRHPRNLLLPPNWNDDQQIFNIVVDMSCMADVPPMLPFWLHWYLTAFRFQVKGIPLLLQEQNLRLQPLIFPERLGQSRPTGGKAKRDRGARIQLSGYILGCSQCLTLRLRRSARKSYNLF